MTAPTQPPAAPPAPTTATGKGLSITVPPILGFPVSTVILIILAIVGGVLLIVDGNLPSDYATYAAVIGGTNGLVAIGRGLDANAKP